MAALWWHNDARVLSPALASLGELKNVIGGSLREKGFTSVRVNPLEVAGGKNQCWVSIAHFHIADRRYWEVVMCGGDTADKTRKTVDEVVALLHSLRFL